MEKIKTPVERAEYLKWLAVSTVEDFMDSYIASIKAGASVFEIALEIKVEGLAEVKSKLTCNTVQNLSPSL